MAPFFVPDARFTTFPCSVSGMNKLSSFAGFAGIGRDGRDAVSDTAAVPLAATTSNSVDYGIGSIRES